MEAPHFSGWATKAGLKCSDGRVIMKGAFEHAAQEMTVPLVWQHGHNTPTNVLGKAVLEHRADGVYCHGYFNETDHGQAAKALVEHGDVKFLSIYANQLMEKMMGDTKQVLHGAIREVSLVLAGANPGAKIEWVGFQHSDGTVDDLDDVAIIHTGLEIKLETLAHAEGDEETVEDVYESLSDKQKGVVHYIIGAALEAAGDSKVKHSDTSEEDAANGEQSDGTATDAAPANGAKPEDSAVDSAPVDGTPSTDSSTDTNNEGDLAHKEGTDMTRNVFEQNGTGSATGGPTLSHDAMKGILESAQKSGSFIEAAKEYALAHSITNLELMFPDAKNIGQNPEMIQRRTEWVAKVLDGVKKTPFVNVKTLMADITADEARAKGYAKGNQKVEEVLVLLARTTGPTTIYKKQGLDRDDLLDITEYDVVNWLWAEMRLMIEEEVARAILVGDGRSVLSPDKVKDPAGSVDGKGIRSILNDADLFSVKHELAANVSAKDAVKGLVRARSKYRGTGTPTLFISDDFLTDLMLEEDKFGRALYETQQALADKLRVKDIVTVDLFNEHDNLFAIMVSLQDYNIGTNAGGQLTRFEDFDIDFNKYKYLQETRLSGALVRPYSAIVVLRGEGTLAVATAPSFDGTTDTITIPTVTGVNYYINDEVVTGDVVIDGPTEVEAAPADGYYLASNTTRTWVYTP